MLIFQRVIGMALLNHLKIWALIHAVNNMSEKKIADLIEDYQRKEFGDQADKAIGVTADTLIKIALELHKRRA